MVRVPSAWFGERPTRGCVRAAAQQTDPDECFVEFVLCVRSEVELALARLRQTDARVISDQLYACIYLTDRDRIRTDGDTSTNVTDGMAVSKGAVMNRALPFVL